MIEYQDVAAAIQRERGDAIVVTAMTQSKFWKEASDRPELDIPTNNSMGKVSSIAFGIALGAPDRKVIALDGDGSLIMNMGSLVTVGNKSPKNFVHVVYDNGVYAITGGQPVPNAGKVSFMTLARGAGYASAFEFEDLEEFATSLDRLMSATGPVLVSLKTEPEVENTPLNLRPRGRARRTPEAIKDVRQALAG